MKIKYVIGFIVIAACVGVGAFMLKTSMTPYLPFKEAMIANGREVQVIGTIVKGTRMLDSKTGKSTFKMKDEAGTEMTVETVESLPTNFEHAKSVVAIGTYKDGAFQSSRLLLKCPSKYEKKSEGENGKG